MHEPRRRDRRSDRLDLPARFPSSSGQLLRHESYHGVGTRTYNGNLTFTARLSSFTSRSSRRRVCRDDADLARCFTRGTGGGTIQSAGYYFQGQRLLPFARRGAASDPRQPIRTSLPGLIVERNDFDRGNSGHFDLVYNWPGPVCRPATPAAAPAVSAACRRHGATSNGDSDRHARWPGSRVPGSRSCDSNPNGLTSQSNVAANPAATWSPARRSSAPRRDHRLDEPSSITPTDSTISFKATHRRHLLDHGRRHVLLDGHRASTAARTSAGRRQTTVSGAELDPGQHDATA